MRAQLNAKPSIGVMDRCLVPLVRSRQLSYRIAHLRTGDPFFKVSNDYHPKPQQATIFSTFAPHIQRRSTSHYAEQPAPTKRSPKALFRSGRLSIPSTYTRQTQLVRLALTQADPQSERRDLMFTLSDGRKLGYSEFGDPNGTPVFYFHGYIGARTEAIDWHETAKLLGVRIISLDRPGMDLSSFHPNRRILDYPRDVRELARHLRISKYFVCGVSSGGPYAIACAYAIPKEELLGSGVVAGMGPWPMGTSKMMISSKFMFNAMKHAPLLWRWVIDKVYVPVFQDPNPKARTKFWKMTTKRMNDEDRAVLEQDKAVKVLLETAVEGFRQGSDGYMQEGELMTSNWGFRLEDVDSNKIILWYGTEDRNAPCDGGEFMAERLPNAEYVGFEGESHFTLVEKHCERILGELVSGQVVPSQSPHCNTIHD